MDDLQVSSDMDWYECQGDSAHCQKSGKNHDKLFKLKFKRKVFPVIYNEMAGITNEIVWSLLAGELKIWIMLYFDCNTCTSIEAKDLGQIYGKHTCHYYTPKVMKQDCPGKLKFLFRE